MLLLNVGVNMPRGKKLCRSCSALISSACEKCTACGFVF